MTIICNFPGRSSIKFYRGSLSLGLTPCVLRPSFLQKRYSFRTPLHSSLMVKAVQVACYRHFIPRGYSTNFYRDNPCPGVHVLTFPHIMFDRKGTPFVYHSMPFGGWGVEWLVTGILKWAQTIQGSMGRKTALKSNSSRYFNWNFFFLVTKSY